MRETAVPLKLGNRIVGYLKTGQVFTSKPSPAVRAEVAECLRAAGRPEAEIAELLRLYRATPLLDKSNYASMVTILSAFGLQLMTLANQILLEGRSTEPQAVAKARQYISEHIDDKLTLGDVAAAVNVSTFYLCKIFKQSTGMTFTEYVNRQRIQMAKRALLKSDRQVTEIAYDVGYQSLSQFNRSFHKIVGESPSMYRKHLVSRKGDHLVA
jgi:AraC-like DNA-binding protein